MKISENRGRDLRQFAKFLLVGGGNTLVTLTVILTLKSVFGVNPWLSNAAGYVAGVINSFFWNKLWVFRSHERKVYDEALRFLIGFGVCYCAQFAVTWGLTRLLGMAEWTLPGDFVLSSYGLSTLIGMAVYTLANFIYNRLVTFR